MPKVDTNIAHIARQAGFAYQTIYCYIHGRRRAPFEKAGHLEKVTGVDKLIWLEGDPTKIQAALEASPMVNS